MSDPDATSFPFTNISLGKFSYDQDSQNWHQSTQISGYGDPFIKYNYEAPGNDIDSIEYQENYLGDSQVSLAFQFKIPVKAVMKEYPQAQFMISIGMNTKNADRSRVKVEITDEPKTEIEVTPIDQGENVKNIVLKNRLENEKQIKLMLVPNCSEVCIHDVEILFNQDQSYELSLLKTGNSKGASRNSYSKVDEQVIDEFDDEPDQRNSLSEPETSKIQESQKTKHEDRNLSKEIKDLNNARSYLKAIDQQIPLGKLYKLMASCNHTEGSDYVGVLLKIQDKNIVQINDNKEYLVQVWKQGGQMVFEKSLEEPVFSWNITKDKFMFKKESESRSIYVVSMKEQTRPRVFNFILPEIATKDKVSRSIEESNTIGQLFLPELEDPGNQASDEDQDQFQDSARVLQLKSALRQVSPLDGQPDLINEKFGQHIIQRAPRKMIDYVHGFIVLADHDRFCYFQAESFMEEEKNDEIEKTVEISEDQFQIVQLMAHKKIICIQEIGSRESCFVIEDLNNGRVRFLQPKKSNLGSKAILQLVGLGCNNQDEKDYSPVHKFRSTLRFDDETKMWYWVAMLLRLDGTVEFYSDFIYTEMYIDDDNKCVDIEIGAQDFFLKCINTDEENNKKLLADPQETSEQILKQVKNFTYNFSRVATSWKNRIGKSTMKIATKSEVGTFEQVMHRQVSQYMNLFPQMAMFATYMIVAHRNMISLFDMGHENKWLHTVRVQQNSDDHVRKLQVKKREKNERTNIKVFNQSVTIEESSFQNQSQNQKEQSVIDKFEIMCLAGTNNLIYRRIVIDDKAHASFAEDEPECNLQVSGRVLELVNDREHGFGVIVLTDNGEVIDDFTRSNDCLLYNFPLRDSIDQASKGLELKCIKMRTKHSLLSLDKVPELLTSNYHDISFRISLANIQMFRKLKPDDPTLDSVPQDDVLLKYCKRQNTIRFLSITVKDMTLHFPIVKDRNSEQKKKIDNIKLLQDMKQIRNMPEFKRIIPTKPKNNKVSLSKSINDQNQLEYEPILEEFYTTFEEFSKDKDSYIQITRNTIQIFNQQQKITLNFSNLNLRNAIQIHQRYIYACADRIGQASVTVTRHSQDGKLNTQKIPLYYKHGYYVFNVQALFRGSVLNYKVTKSASGLCNQIEYNKFTERLAYMQDYNTVVVIPVPHLNTVNCNGMDNKQEYLVWREKGSFFTALHKRRKILQTWSKFSGNLLQEIPQDEDLINELEDYKVYRANDNDCTYTRNYYNLQDCSISLLQRAKAVEEYKTDQISHMPDRMSMLDVQQQIKIIIETERNKTQNSNFSGMDFDNEMNLNKFFKKNDKIDLVNSNMKFKLYHFKVIELRTFEDNKSEVNNCRIRFHFLHRLLQKPKRDKTQPNYTEERFEWNQALQNTQHFFLSQNTMRMMELVNNSFAIVYERKNVGQDDKTIDNQSKIQEDTGQMVNWMPLYKITRWPSLLCKKFQYPYMFSPNFEYQLDFRFYNKSIVVLHASTQIKYMTLDIDMIKMKWLKLPSEEAQDLVFSHVRFCSDFGDEKTLRITTQNNLDCILRMETTDEKDKDPEKRYIKVISVSKVDNLFTDLKKQKSQHFYFSPFNLKKHDVMERILRMNQNYKVEIQHAINLGKLNSSKEFKQFTLEQIHKIDFFQPWTNLDSSFALEKTYTWLDWLSIEQAIKKSDFDLSVLPDEQKLQLAHTIVANGQGFLHKLASTRDARLSQTIRLAQDLFEFSQRKAQPFLEGVEEPQKFEIPILWDVNKRTPLDICLKISNKVGQEKFWPKCKTIICSPFNYIKERTMKKNEEKATMANNIMLAGIIFENIKTYRLLHSSQQIIDAVIEGIRIGLPSVKDYLESRILKCEHPQMRFSQPRLKKKIRREYIDCNDEDSIQSYGVMAASIWGRTKPIKDYLFKKDKPKQPTSIETIDLPELHDQLPRGYAFIEALYACPDLEFFTLKSVQILIDHHYEFWYQVNLQSVILPAFVNNMLFQVWNNFVLPYRLLKIQKRELKQGIATDLFNNSLGYVEVDHFVRVILVLLTGYLLIGELYIAVMKIWHQASSNFMMKTMIYLSLHALVIYNVILANDEKIQDPGFWKVEAWVAFAVWFRFMFSYMREVKKFSWIIGLIIFCAYSTINFMVIYLVGITAFADIFNALNQAMYLETQKNLEYDQIEISLESIGEIWLDDWQISFRASLGDFPDLWAVDAKYFDYISWSFFFFSMIFIEILLLNLLISIVTEAQGFFTEQHTSTSYKEKSNLIRQKGYSFFYPLFKSDCRTDSVLYVVQQNMRDQKQTDEEKSDLPDASADQNTYLNDDFNDTKEDLNHSDQSSEFKEDDYDDDSEEDGQQILSPHNGDNSLKLNKTNLIDRATTRRT